MNTYREAIRNKDLAVTATLPLRPKTTASQIKAMAKTLAPVVDAIQLGDDRHAVGHMSALAAASVVLQGGLDAIMQISCRDRNRIALQAEILGAAALGVTTLILGRGEKFSDTAAMRSKGVFEIGATRLTAIASQVSAEPGLVDDPGFHIGSFITVFAPGENWQANGVREKLDTGVKLLQTQPCLNAKRLRTYMQKLVELKVTHRAAVVVEVPILTSVSEVKVLKEAHKGAPIPDAAVERIAHAEDPVAEGVLLCAEMIEELRTIPGISGVNILHGGNPENVVAAINRGRTGPC